MRNSRNYKEFLKNRTARRDEATQLQQKGAISPKLDNEIADFDKEKKDAEPMKESTKEHVKEPLKEIRLSDVKREVEVRSEIEHDIQDQAAGRIYNIPGANVDQDEVNKMARNGIRDADELVSESLLNDGYDPGIVHEVLEAKDLMEGYLHDGNGLEQIKRMDEKYGKESIALAFVEVAKKSSIRDLHKLERIVDLAAFEKSVAYEDIFDRISERDSDAALVLERLDLEIGLERRR